MNILDRLSIHPNQELSFAHQLKQQIAWLIASGELKTGDQLPPVQVMAKRLGINLHTVRGAYQKLAAEGLVEMRQGRGTHVLPYDPARMARAASMVRSHTIGVIIPSWTNPFYHAILQGVEEVAGEDQSLLFLCNYHDEPATAARDFARLSAKQVDGIIVASFDISQVLFTTSSDDRTANRLPLVTIDWPECAGYAVLIDLQQVGYQATSHLLEHGHRRIGLITFAQEVENVIPVNWGFEQALKAYGLSLDPTLIARVPGFDMAAGAEGAKMLLAQPEPPTAIFAIADMLALGAMQAIKKSDLRIPEDIALVSFNDIPSAALVEPPLTTVAAPTVQLGREAMKMLQVLIAGERPPQKHLTLSTALVIRESCGCAKIS